MKLDDQIRTLPTLAGLISTICVILVVSSYSMIQFEKLVLKEGEDILETTKEDFFDDTHELTFEDGINFAVGLSSFDTNTEPILDPQYGELVFLKRRWKFSQEEGELEDHNEVINTHTCTREELGLDDSENSLFYPMN